MQKNKLDQPIASSLYKPRSKKFSFSKFFKNTALFTLFFSFFLAIAILPSQLAQAEEKTASDSSLYKKIILLNALRCHNRLPAKFVVLKQSGIANSGFLDPVDTRLSVLFDKDSHDNPVTMFAGQGGVKDYNLKCHQFFLGGQNFHLIFKDYDWKLGTGFIESSGNKIPKTYQDLSELLLKLGYKAESTDNLISIPFMLDDKPLRTRNIRLNLNKDKIDTIDIVQKDREPGDAFISDIALRKRIDHNMLHIGQDELCIGWKEGFHFTGYHKCVKYKGKTKDKFKNEIAQAASSVFSDVSFQTRMGDKVSLAPEDLILDPKRLSADTTRLVYFIDVNDHLGKLDFFREFGYAPNIDLNLNKEEKLALYLTSISDGFFKGETPNAYISCKKKSDKITSLDGFKEIKFGFNGDKFAKLDISEICFMKTSNTNGLKEVFLPDYKDGRDIYFSKDPHNKKVDLPHTIDLANNLIEELKKDPKFNLDKVLEESAGFSGDSKTDTEQNAEGVSDPCYQNGGPSGWMLCPVINGIRDAFENIFKDFFINTMNVSSTIFEQDDEDKGVYGVWKQFRDYANIFFIIVLLVIVISQLTGLGIDNYGIKRLLPKIITVAILTNLSYIISQVLVDISNIVGKSIYDLLTNIANATPIDVGGRTTSDFIMLAIGIISLIVSAFSLGTGLIWTFAVFLVGLAISAFFMFVVLSVRKALTIMLIVVSPLAFMAYLLPNTKTFFDKWKDAMKASLFLYPICSFVIGGGYLAGRILMSTAGSGDVVQHFAALILMFAPFFAVPSLAKTSLRAFGDLGNRISGIGKVASRAATDGIKKTDLYKDALIKSAASEGIGGWRKKIADSKFGKATGFSSKYASSRGRVYAREKEKSANERLLNDTSYAALLRKVKSDAERETVEAYSTSDDFVAKTKNYDIDTMTNELVSTLNKGEAMTEEDQIMAKALTQSLVKRGGIGQKNFASIAGKITSQRGTEFIANHIQKDSDASSALIKDQFAAQYFQDIASGLDYAYNDIDGVRTAMSFEEWKRAIRSDGMTNAEYVANKRMSNNVDFFNQSSGAISEALQYVPEDRLRGMATNTELVSSFASDQDKINALKAAIDKANLKLPKEQHIFIPRSQGELLEEISVAIQSPRANDSKDNNPPSPNGNN